VKHVEIAIRDRQNFLVRVAFFCHKWQVQVTGEGEEMENIFKTKTL
jgi:hypothetical protein